MIFKHISWFNAYRKRFPKMLEDAPVSVQAIIRQKFEKVARSAQGMYALVDYVNFKGEGVLASERYRGEGWGLLQVLEGMQNPSSNSPTKDFAQSAKVVLNRRVQQFSRPNEMNRAGCRAG